MDNWNKLKSRLEEMLGEFKNYRGRSGPYNAVRSGYQNVLKLMNAIENGTDKNLKIFDGAFKTQEEIDKLLYGFDE